MGSPNKVICPSFKHERKFEKKMVLYVYKILAANGCLQSEQQSQAAPSLTLFIIDKYDVIVTLMTSDYYYL